MARPPRPNVRSWLGCLLTGAASDRRFMRRTSLASERTRSGPFRGGRVRPPGGTGWTAASVLNTPQELRRYSAARNRQELWIAGPAGSRRDLLHLVRALDHHPLVERGAG